jgi:hypothetical protein
MHGDLDRSFVNVERLHADIIVSCVAKSVSPKATHICIVLGRLDCLLAAYRDSQDTRSKERVLDEYLLIQE